MTTSDDRFETFRALHQRDRLFVLANAWDTGSARILKALGYEAIGTTSAGATFVAGRKDGAGEITRETALEHAKELVDATDLPVSADLEDGFAAAPKAVAETIRAAADIGLAGCSIEDATGNPDQPIYPFQQAVERIEAAVEAIKSLERPFVLTARSENFSYNRPDLDDTIARLQAFEKAGADVLYAPQLPDLDAVRTVCDSVAKPVNVVTGLGLPDDVTLQDLEAVGVRRVSFGSALARVAIGAMLRAARATMVDGDLSIYGTAAGFAEIDGLIAAGSPDAGGESSG